MAHSEFVGVDGCKAGWFSVGFSGTGDYEVMGFFVFADLLAYHKDAKLILVDIPIGLPDGAEGRACDGEARNRLPVGRGKSSVFPTPTRHTVNSVKQAPGNYKHVYDLASNAEQESAGKGLSKQAFAITPKIGEVDDLLPRQSPKVREVHPEICFWALNGKQPMGDSKHTTEGIEERIRVLNPMEPRTRKILAKARCKYPAKSVAKDDILDALAAAVTAYKGHHNLQTLPANPPEDSKGLPMEMVYCIPEPSADQS